MSRSHPKTILITGCSRDSIGDQLAQECLRRGLQVIATARTLSKVQHLKETGGNQIDIFELDTTSTESIKALRSKITRLDILFNNAGVNLIAALSDTSMPAFRGQFDVNVFGTAAVTQAFLPLIVESKGIIVNHTSQSAYAISSLCGAYAASKAALATYTDVLRIELAPFDIRVMELVTGGAMSNITADMRPPYVPDDSMYALIRPEMEAACDPERVRKMVMPGDVYARKVVGDLLRSRGPPKWTWRGALATTMWFLWTVKCLWKGVFDGLIARTFGAHLLKSRLKEAEMKRTPE